MDRFVFIDLAEGGRVAGVGAGARDPAATRDWQASSSIARRTGPVSLALHEDFSCSVVVCQFGVQEGAEVVDAVDFGFLDVEHSALYVVAGLVVFCLLGSCRLFEGEVVFLCFLQFVHRGVVGEAAGFEALASGLEGRSVMCCMLW